MEACRNFVNHWTNNGLGWFCEVYKNFESEKLTIRAYFGSSNYNTKEMTDLINYIVADCEDQGIETKTPEEINSMLESWEKNGKRNSKK